MSNNNELTSPDISSSVAVIITCYNLGEYIIEAINSVKEQSSKAQEIIVVDDGSNDEYTVGVINDIVKDEDIKLIKQDNKGVSNARNNAARQTSCDYILFLDADDILHRDFIKLTKEMLDDDISKSIGFVTTWVKTFGLSDSIWETKGSEYEDEIISNEICGSSLMRREMFNDIGGYSEDLVFGYEDWDFWISAIEKGYKWGVVKEPLFNYRIRSKSRNEGAIEKDQFIKCSIVSRHPSLYLNKIIDQKAIIQEQLGEIKLLNEEIATIKNNNQRKIIKQAIELRNSIDKINDRGR